MNIQSNIKQAVAKLQSITDAKQLPFAIARALTVTARDVQDEVRNNLAQRFTLRNNWVRQGIQIQRATKQNLEAMVFSRDAFMGLQEVGGAKSPLGNYLAVPTSLVRRTPKAKPTARNLWATKLRLSNSWAGNGLHSSEAEKAGTRTI
jgi:hypothetical protein